MLAPKKIISSLAMAALPLTGTGCSGASPVENLNNSVRAFCMKLAECGYYDSTDECVAEYQYYIDEYVAQVSDGCINLLASYFQCVAGYTCDELENGAYYQCFLDIEDDFDRECSPIVQ